MAIKYKIIEKGKPGDPEAEKLYYAIPILSGTTSFQKIMQLMSLRCTVHSSDVLAVLNVFFEVIKEEFDDGRAVEIFMGGRARLSFSCKGKKNKEDVTPADITKRRIVFKPGPEIRDMLKTLTFVKTK